MNCPLDKRNRLLNRSIECAHMKDRIIEFLNDLDATLIVPASGDRLPLYHIGRSALVWRYGFASSTDDVDVIQPGGGGRLLVEALQHFGRGTAKAEQHGLYLEQVPEGLPPVPGGFDKRAEEVEGDWKVLRIYHLQPDDLAATKLKRFAAKDREDIQMMCDIGLLDPDRLQVRLESTFRYTLEKDGDRDRDKAFAHLAVVQAYLREGNWNKG